MKRLVAALVLLAITAGICLGSRLTLDHATRRLLEDLEKIEERYKAEDLAASADLADRFAGDFEATTRLLPLFLPHSVLESTAQTASLLPVLARTDRVGFLREIARCRSQLTQMRELEKIDWKNFF